MWTQRLMWIAWPAFLVAGVIEMLVFAMVDPQDLHWFGQPVTLSRTGVYTLAFFGFWALTMVSSALTTLLAMSRPDPVVAEDYYQRGIDINKTLEHPEKSLAPAMKGRNHAATPPEAQPR